MNTRTPPLPTLRRTLVALALLALAAGALPARAHARSGAPAGAPDAESLDQDLTDLSLEELMDIEVTIASRTAQKLSDVPGAVYVISGDEIRRSGHTTIQEALRMVPGFYVSNWTSAQWDVTSRGFGTGVSLTSLGFLNQLLVMVDGLVVYSPLYAGTWWAIQDIDLDDVDRIEVIRGPGGLLWGSNAIHGVVHVITKQATETLGGRFSIRGGTDEWNTSARFGARMGETGAYRFYYRYGDRDGNANEFLGFSQDWYLHVAGARFDWGEGRRNTVWLRGYDGEFGNEGFDLNLFVPIPVDDEKSGVQAFASTTSEDGKGTFSGWVTFDQQELPTELDAEILSYDLEYRRVFDLTSSTSLTAGLGFRQVRSDLRGEDPFYIYFDPRKETQSNYRAFLMHEWRATEELSLTLGAQAEHNEFSGFDLQPTARLSWHPTADFTLWSAVTRSVRTPSLEEVGLNQNSLQIGDPDFDTEKALTYELGVRKQFGPVAVVDLAAFYNDYDDLHDEEFDGVGQYQLTNGAEGESYGIEAAIDLKPVDRWRLRSAYSYIHGDFEDATGASLDTGDYHPEHMFNLRSYYDLGRHLELDAAAYLYEGFGSDYEEAERLRIDVRLGWRPREDVELYVGAQQLNDDRASEYDEYDLRRRQFFVGLRWGD